MWTDIDDGCSARAGLELRLAQGPVFGMAQGIERPDVLAREAGCGGACSGAVRAMIGPLGACPVEICISSRATSDAMPHPSNGGNVRCALSTRSCAGGDLNAQVPAAIASTQTGSPIHGETTTTLLRAIAVPINALRAIADNASEASTN